MPKDTDQIVVGANGAIRVAPTTATLPADIDAAYSGDWIDLGYANEDGVTFTDAKTLEVIRVWQLFYPARRIITERDLTVAFVLRQFAGNQVEFAFGGGEVSVDGAGKYRFTPPDPEVIDERRLAIDWSDGDDDYRLILSKGMVTENVETKIARTQPSDLPITFGINGEDGIEPWVLLTNDDSFLEATGA